jgi:hypothetical protein
VIVPTIIKFETVRKRLESFGITWNKTRGKGSDGLFQGSDGKGIPRSYTLGHQRAKKGIYRVHVNSIRRRFGLVPPSVTDEDFWGSEFI